MATRFYLAKLDFDAQFLPRSDSVAVGGTAKTRQTLNQYFEQDDLVIESGGSEWRIGGTDEDATRSFAVGNFGKLYQDRPQTYDEEEGEFKTEELEEMAETSMFLAHYDLGFVAFNQRQRIGYNQFTTAFSRGYNQWCDIYNALSLPFITPQDELERIIDETVIKSLEFDLEPTNPYPSEAMESLDREINDMEAEEVELNAESDGGLNPQSELLQSALSFASSPYGDVKVEYREDGGTYEFNTKNRPASVKIDHPSDLADFINKSKPIIDRAEQLLN